MNLADVVTEVAGAEPRRTALRERSGSTSYGELIDRAAGVAAGLRDLGVRPHDRVAISMPRGRDAIAAYFGALAVGAVVVLIDVTARRRQVANLLADSGARVLLVAEGVPVDLDPEDRTIPVVSAAELPAAASAIDPVPRAESDVAQLVYTSGSTGRSKGVMLTHGNLTAAARIIPRYLGLDAADRIASVLPLGFVYGLSQLLCAIAVGASLVIDDSVLPADTIDWIAAEGASVLAGVPGHWHRWLATGGFRDRPIPSLRVMTVAGGGLSEAVAQAVRRAQPQARLFPMYGLTEAIRTTYLPAEEHGRRPGSIGVPIPETEVLVVREDGGLASPGEVAELVQIGPTVAAGYWGDPERTDRVFRPDPRSGAGRALFTGDLGHRDEAGFLYFDGRRDRQIKSLGYRVNPEEVELALGASGLVVAVAVTTMPDPERGQAMIAHVVPRPGTTVTQLRRFSGRELPSHLQPVAFRIHEELPRLVSGKPDLVRLAAVPPGSA